MAKGLNLSDLSKSTCCVLEGQLGVTVIQEKQLSSWGPHLCSRVSGLPS